MTAALSLVSWNVTRRCNLRCPHCYLDAGARSSDDDELTTLEGRDFIDQLAALCPGAMLVFSGGEPLLRADLPELIAYAAGRGLLPVLGTNAVLLTVARARALAAGGLAGVGLSLDSLDRRRHDSFRGLTGAWERTVAAIDACHRCGLAVQIHATATRDNWEEIPALIAFAAERGAVAFHLFFLVCTGRGERMSDISPEQYEAALQTLAAAQEEYRGRMLVRARCAPHFRRLVSARSVGAAVAGAGCLAGKTYCRVTPTGDVTPCPYLPLVAGNLRAMPLARIWEAAPVFQQLRRPELQGRCGVCEFAELCGGCRARAQAVSGDMMAEDPWCKYQPGSAAPPVAVAEKTDDARPQWTPAARARMTRIPAPLRPMVEKAVEAYARSQGLTTVTPAMMAELRARNMPPGRFPGPRPFDKN